MSESVQEEFDLILKFKKHQDEALLLLKQNLPLEDIVFDLQKKILGGVLFESSVSHVESVKTMVLRFEREIYQIESSDEMLSRFLNIDWYDCNQEMISRKKNLTEESQEFLIYYNNQLNQMFSYINFSRDAFYLTENVVEELHYALRILTQSRYAKGNEFGFQKLCELCECRDEESYNQCIRSWAEHLPLFLDDLKRFYQFLILLQSNINREIENYVEQLERIGLE